MNREAHPGLTAVQLLRDGREAFAARHRLATAARHSIAVQYYIWRDDTSGGLLLHALWEAADRGVRVRMLLDDANTRGLDPLLAALDSHPRIEVRLFNPFRHRNWRLVNFVGDFARLNRRMHNKLFLVDGETAILGGRNIGDEYLGATTAVEFADLDVAASGAVVGEAAASFEAYWNCAATAPAARMLPATSPELGRRRMQARAAQVHASAKAKDYLAATDAHAASQPVEWAVAHLLVDEPDKVLHPPGRREMHMLPRLVAALGEPERDMLLVSPYFVPTRQGTDGLLAIAARGVRVSVLTNSLAATDVAAVYAGYAKYRHALLRGGVRLFELKPTAGRQRHGRAGPARGNSGASLHAKTFAVDGLRVFVGSFNLDPRSARLNTESGIVIESRALAAGLGYVFAHETPEGTYEVRLHENGRGLVWLERREGEEIRHTHSPETGRLRRALVRAFGWLPIEWLL